jgi:hypothetical protein
MHAHAHMRVYACFSLKNDSMTEMDNIAETTRAKFEKHGITTVLGMKMITVTTISAIMEDNGFRVSETTVEKWKHEAEQAHKGSMPSQVRLDHRKEENHYLSRYVLDS